MHFETFWYFYSQISIQSTLHIVNTICSGQMFTIWRGSLYRETDFLSQKTTNKMLKRQNKADLLLSDAHCGGFIPFYRKNYPLAFTSWNNRRWRCTSLKRHFPLAMCRSSSLVLFWSYVRLRTVHARRKEEEGKEVRNKKISHGGEKTAKKWQKNWKNREF